LSDSGIALLDGQFGRFSVLELYRSRDDFFDHTKAETPPGGQTTLKNLF